MIESATLEEEHQRVSNPSEKGVVKSSLLYEIQVKLIQIQMINSY